MTIIEVTERYLYITKSMYIQYDTWGTLQHSWLRHYATSQKVTDSISNEVIE
jgi:hypothetical protein